MNDLKLKNGFGKTLAVALSITLVFVAGLITDRYVVSSPGLVKSQSVSEFSEMESASYIIFKENSTYYARNGKTGAIDYSGTDASKIIQNAINASMNGGKIFFKTGTYDLASSLVLKSFVWLAGEGMWVVKLNSKIADGSPIITTLGQDDVRPLHGVRISDLSVEGNGAEGDGIYFEFCVGESMIENVRVVNVGATGIHLHHSYGMTIRNVWAHNNGGYGIFMEDRSQASRIEDSWVEGNGNYGIYITSRGNYHITGVISQNNANGDLYLDFVHSTAVINSHFERNTAGVFITINHTAGTNYARSITIMSSYFNGAERTDVDAIVVDRGQGITIQGNYIYAVNNGIHWKSASRWGLSINNHFMTIGNKVIWDEGTNNKAIGEEQYFTH